MKHFTTTVVFLCFILVHTVAAWADEPGGGAAEMARKLQDPLANIKAVMTDNTIGFNTGDGDGTSYGFQIQPVYSIDLPDKGFTILVGNYADNSMGNLLL